MARIIAGERPQIEVKTWTYSVTDVQLVASPEISEWITAKAKREGVPEEASLSAEPDVDLNLTVYTWRWWEITI